MPRETKLGRATLVREATTAAPPVPRLTERSARWFAAVDPSVELPAERRRSPLMLMAAALVLGAVTAFTLIKDFVARAVVPSALAITALGVAWRTRRSSGAPSERARTRTRIDARKAHGRGLELDGERLAFLNHPRAKRASSVAEPHVRVGARADGPDSRSIAVDPSQTVVLLDAPFGVTLLASPRRERLIAMISSAAGTFYLGAAFDAAARRAFAPLLDRAFTVVGDDVGLDAIGPDGEPLVLAPDELASLLDALVEESPSCLDRFVLTDARGAAFTLDGRALCVGDRAVDLNAPLEWKPIVFQEAFGQAIAVYQGTWIRQNGAELVLVSLLPAHGSTPLAELDLGSLDRAVLRDLRLMQAAPSSPPPAEQRVAIDRLLMLPVRSALDRAPRASHQPNRAQA